MPDAFLPFGAQLVVRESRDDGFVALRDRLIADENALRAYNSVKQRHASDTGEAYCTANGAWIEALLADRAGGSA